MQTKQELTNKIKTKLERQIENEIEIKHYI